MKTLDQITLSNQDRRAVEAASEILHRQFPVERVILFGSKARGDDDPESDIDLLVLTTRPVSAADKERMTDALFDLQIDRGVVISKLVVPLDDWEHGLYQALPIHWQIEREGVAA